MTTQRSQRVREVHGPRRSEALQEPPTEASFPSSDEEIGDQRSLDEWGNSMEKTRDHLADRFPEYQWFFAG